MAGRIVQSEDVHTQAQNYNVQRYLPEVRVSFHTDEECYQTKGRKLDRGETPDPTYQIRSVSTQKNLNNPAGGFTVTLTGDQWADRLTSNDLVVISMGYMGGDMTTVMVGLVDRVQTKRSAGSGEPQVMTTVTGRDFGKTLIKSQLKFYPEIGVNTDVESKKFFLTDAGWIDMLSIFTGQDMVKGSPAVVLDKIMANILPKLNEVEWSVYDETKKEPVKKTIGITHILRYTFEQTDFFLPFMLTADQFEGALWNLMERVTQKPFTELFIDTRDAHEAWHASGDDRVVVRSIEESSDGSSGYPPSHGFGFDGAKVLLAYRTTPFDTKDRKKLISHEVDAVDVLDEDLEKSDEEHYNLFWAGTTINPLGDLNLKMVVPPLINEDDIKRYGLSPLEVQIEGLAVDRGESDEHKANLEQLTAHYTGLLKSWFENNHNYLSGNLITRGRANYRVGQRLIYTDQEKEFYIEGVNQSFNVFHDWSTTLAVTRGMATDERINSEDNTRETDKPKENKAKEADEASTEPNPDVYYTVSSGDTLWVISAMDEHYGDGSKWRKIWEANQDMLIARDERNATDHGKWIYPGMKLRIPK